MNATATAKTAWQLLQDRGLSPTTRRMAVLMHLLDCDAPQTAPDILQAVQSRCELNKATLYRILDLLVDRELLLRHSAGERSFRYCALSPAVHDARNGHDGQAMHCHFHCTRCGAMQCLKSRSLLPDCRQLAQTAGGVLHSVEIRLDGLCRQCADS